MYILHFSMYISHSLFAFAFLRLFSGVFALLILLDLLTISLFFFLYCWWLVELIKTIYRSITRNSEICVPDVVVVFLFKKAGGGGLSRLILNWYNNFLAQSHNYIIWPQWLKWHTCLIWLNRLNDTTVSFNPTYSNHTTVSFGPTG